jgi:hypothetical protein
MHPPSSDPLGRALDEAIAGRPATLFALLERGSRLPGPHANDALADAFALACRARHPKADAIAFAMARLSADEAPGAGPREFLPVCGISALGARAATDATLRSAVITELHTHADDLRFRVRNAVIDALVHVGAVAGDALVLDVAPWMDGYFHAAAVVTALARESWLGQMHDPAPLVARLDEAFVLARDAPRAAARYPGRKALVDVLATTPGIVAIRFGVPVFDMLVRWAVVSDPELRALLAATLIDKRLVTRFAPELARVRSALESTEPPVRNPDHDVGPTRDRSGARRRSRR